MKENMKAAVLRVVNEHADALEAKEVYRQVQAESREQFDSTVQALTNDGSLIVTKRGKLISPKSSGFSAGQNCFAVKGLCLCPSAFRRRGCLCAGRADEGRHAG